MFIFNNSDVTSHILSFFGEKRGYGDLQDATKERLLEVALELRMLVKDDNDDYDDIWGIKVNEHVELAC